MCCGWDGELEYTVVLECMDCGTAFNESLSTMYTNTSFLKSKNGLYIAFVSTKNKCGEKITVNASHTVNSNIGMPEYAHIHNVHVHNAQARRLVAKWGGGGSLW